MRDNLTTIHLHQTSEASTSIFTQNELTHLSEQRIGRLATADRNGRPHIELPTVVDLRTAARAALRATAVVARR